jgi:hypothetical protein
MDETTTSTNIGAIGLLQNSLLQLTLNDNYAAATTPGLMKKLHSLLAGRKMQRLLNRLMRVRAEVVLPRVVRGSPT